jgi:ADP-ribosyl-[dinitrogen reductase] hydrolase
MNRQSSVSRAQGCLFGQLAGDSLGSLVEFQGPAAIKRLYPGGVRYLVDGGHWDTIAGQPTDDSEMALMLARTLIKHGVYDPVQARNAYICWLKSSPFDCGNTVRSGLHGRPDTKSQSNGALMRISPLGIWGANYDIRRVSQWAQLDAAITHPHPICVHVNALFAMAISQAIHTESLSPPEIYRRILVWAKDLEVDGSLMKAITDAATSLPPDYMNNQGWVLIAFQNALWQLIHARGLEDAVVNTIGRGGDTDTNAAVCGALLGSVYGRKGIPDQWINCLSQCRPITGRSNVHRPRPTCFWPVDAAKIAEQLIAPRDQYVVSSGP